VLAKWEVRRERQLRVSPDDRSMAQERALTGTRKVVDLFQKMNLAFSAEESGGKGVDIMGGGGGRGHWAWLGRSD
jgi:hypothetical protein